MSYKIYKLNKQKLLNNKGELSLQFVIEMMTILTLVICMVEFTLLGYRHSQAVSTINKMARVISVQSGLNSSAPYGYDTFKKHYVSLKDFQTMAEDKFINDLHVSTYKITLVHKSANGVQKGKYDLKQDVPITMSYNDFFDLVVEYEIKLNFMNNVISGLPNAKGTVVITSICEYKDYWKR